MTSIDSMPRFALDEEGVEGIPLKLIIVVVIVAITVPLAWKGLESYDRIQTENNLRAELEFLSTNIKQIYLNGIGNAQDVNVDFVDGMMTKIERIEIGDTIEGISSSIRYKLNYKDTEFIIIENPNVPLGNMDQDEIRPLSMGSGRHTIHIECKEGLDFDDDGVKDMYVEVSKVI
ncbi:MAG: hypothetical protein JSV09_09925 [Thermoplasmata archaeon]|nr:MAG: hypothetical protein JSV09_09925 [Thermoplasmata archaeon]